MSSRFFRKFQLIKQATEPPRKLEETRHFSKHLLNKLGVCPKMEEIRLNIETFIGANVDTIYRNTGSLEVNKYVKLIIQIVKKRIETKHLTRIDWKNKTIRVKQKTLTDKQLKACYWVLDNREEVKNRVYFILENYLKRHRQPDKLIKKLETKKKIDNKTIF